MRTITTALIRAGDIPDGSYVRRPVGNAIQAAGDWQWVYEVTRGGSKASMVDEDVYVVAAKLDERYVIVRLSVDQHLTIPSTTTAGVKVLNIDRFAGSRAEYEDELVISRDYDLWEIQIPHDTEKENDDRSAG